MMQSEQHNRPSLNIPSCLLCAASVVLAYHSVEQLCVHDAAQCTYCIDLKRIEKYWKAQKSTEL